ncbi:SAM-dependent methyltransferase [Allokutzneria sp. A3M-2-11 16]|uniref:SAM-dependent methyltransferase n=1 Tax=Allokutzneria sp. A3M-2-11 16 TaxID=2962043 RepID=UPI0020B6DF66|nr:SAM-dependent methyltransferase [Allokutzneria sp. A3M-2-11 16]MCP3799792.1 SAM-dependent methyltransferase [Allokutzneria sp. A3M-2-11 16]
MTALERWRDSLAAWEIPADVRPEESPWVLPREVFVRRCDRQVERREGASLRLTEEALGPDGGSVLDIGAAAGAASVPLRGVTELVAVDGDAELLAEFARRAEARTVLGHWPEVTESCPVVDVVVCGHVVYNVADLAPFVAALNEHARRLVVVEMAELHPLTALNPLWRHFHGIERPAGPSADDFADCLRELGTEPRVERWRREPAAEYADFGTLVEVTRRRLCLPPSRLSEVDRQLLALGVDPDRPPDLGSSGDDVVTLSWRPRVIH